MKKILGNVLIGAGIASIIVASGQSFVGLLVMDMAGLVLIGLGFEIKTTTEV